MNLQNPRRARVKREAEEEGGAGAERLASRRPRACPRSRGQLGHLPAACRSGNYQESQERAVRQIWTTVGTAIKIVRAAHDHIQPACRGCLPFSGLLMVLDGDPQAVHGIAAGPAARDVVCHGRHAVARIHRQARTRREAGCGVAGCWAVCRRVRRFSNSVIRRSWAVAIWSVRSRSRSKSAR